MRLKSLTLFSALVLLALSLQNCASLTGYQDGRTVGQGNGEAFGSINFSQSPDFNDLEDNADSINVDFPNIFVPIIELGGRYGVHEKVDIVGRFNTNLNVALGAKVQLIGDRTSKVALAAGAEVGTFGLISGLWNVQVPVSFSVHPKDNFGWYLSPKYIYQFTQYTGASNGLTYLGGNTGILLGRKNQFAVDFGYYRLGVEGQNVGLLTIGVGGKFKFGNNLEFESNSGSKSKKKAPVKKKK